MRKIKSKVNAFLINDSNLIFQETEDDAVCTYAELTSEPIITVEKLDGDEVISYIYDYDATECYWAVGEHEEYIIKKRVWEVCNKIDEISRYSEYDRQYSEIV